MMLPLPAQNYLIIYVLQLNKSIKTFISVIYNQHL